MTTNTISELVIHSDYKPYHLSATHSNISFSIALRNLPNKQTSIFEPIEPVCTDKAYVSHTNAESGTSHQPDWTFCSSMESDDEMIDVYTNNNPHIASHQTIDIPTLSSIQSTSDQTLTIAPQTINVSPPPILLLDSVILKEVSENIFVDLDKLVRTRNNFVHTEDYEEKWTALRERVDTVMCELQKLSLEAHNQSINTFNNWFKDVVNSMKEVEANRNQARSKLYISDSPFYLDASSIITASVHEDLSLNWLTKLKVYTDAPILAKLKCDSEQEQKIKKLEKELFEQKMLYENLKRSMAL